MNWGVFVTGVTSIDLSQTFFQSLNCFHEEYCNIFLKSFSRFHQECSFRITGEKVEIAEAVVLPIPGSDNISS